MKLKQRAVATCSVNVKAKFFNHAAFLLIAAVFLGSGVLDQSAKSITEPSPEVFAGDWLVTGDGAVFPWRDVGWNVTGTRTGTDLVTSASAGCAKATPRVDDEFLFCAGRYWTTNECCGEDWFVCDGSCWLFCSCADKIEQCGTQRCPYYTEQCWNYFDERPGYFK
jgi:hypothetical protein